MGNTSIVRSLNWPMQGTGGLYKTSTITLRVMGWLSFINMFTIAIIGVLVAIFMFVGAEFIAEAAGEAWEDCDASCQDGIRDGGAIAGIATLVITLVLVGIAFLFAKLYSIAARRMAQCHESAGAWCMVFGILSALGFISAMISLDFASMVISGFLVASLLVFPLLPDVKSQLTTSREEAFHLESGHTA